MRAWVSCEDSTKYLGLGSYEEWDEEKRVDFLVRELSGKRPLIPADMPANDVRPMTPSFHEPGG
jgi:phosphoenolpyruvate carboxylase